MLRKGILYDELDLNDNKGLVLIQPVEKAYDLLEINSENSYKNVLANLNEYYTSGGLFKNGLKIKDIYSIVVDTGEKFDDIVDAKNMYFYLELTDTLDNINSMIRVEKYPEIKKIAEFKAGLKLEVY